MPTKAGGAILELIEQAPRSVTELMTETGYGRTAVQENLAKYVSQGKLQRSKEDGRGADGRTSVYSFIQNGKPVIRDWTQMREWKKHDGPIEGLFIDNPQGHLCEWSCDWITPEGIQRSIARDEPEALWWEARDVIARYGDVAVGTDSLVAAMGQVPWPENLEGAPLNAVRQCLSIARTSLYGRQAYLHPTTIKRTGNRRFPLKLAIGDLKVYTGVGFRPGWQPPSEVTKVLLKYARVPGIMGVLNRLNAEEWADIAKMAAAYEEMERETQARSRG